MEKQILHILTGREKRITDTETVRQPLPHKDFRFANPFIVIHHLGPMHIAPGSTERIHPHPHRGFSPYTFMIQGEGYHKDNAGNDELISAGDVQWMFAGRGIMHSEGPTDRLLRDGGIQELVQLWINAPQARKWDAPFYQSARKDTLPKAIREDGVEFRLASGEYNGNMGPIQQFTPVLSMIGEIGAGNTVQFQAKPGFWTLAYVIRGQVIVSGAMVDQYQLVVFEKANDTISVQAATDTQLLFLSAESLEEPIAAKDNFVMNTEAEIEQAIRDYQNGVFGSLEY